MSAGHENKGVTEAQIRLDRVRDLYELMHLLVDFVAGISFVVGSALFFYPAWESLAIWLFLIGSVAFAAKPTLRLAHVLADRRTRQKLEAELSEEAAQELRSTRPQRLLRPFTVT